MSFDLNINNYTKDELISMFELPQNYDLNIIEIQESKLREKIAMNQKINEEIKKNTLDFIEKAKNVLLNINHNHKTDNNIKEFIKDIYKEKFSSNKHK